MKTADIVACVSLRSKRFLVSEQRKTEERDFRFWPREKWNESENRKRGREKRTRCFHPFFPTPPRRFSRAIFHAEFDSSSSFFGPKPHGNVEAQRPLARAREIKRLSMNIHIRYTKCLILNQGSVHTEESCPGRKGHPPRLPELLWADQLLLCFLTKPGGPLT